MKNEYIETERLLLRKFTPDDFKYLFDNHSKDEIMNQLGLATEDDFIRERDKCTGGYTTYDRTILHFKLVLKESGQIIGGGGFHNWYALHRRAELGYALTREDAKQRGYMSEAVKAMLNYGFNEMNLNRIEAFIGPENIASLKLIQKFGFTKEGHLRSHFFKNGKFEDSVVYSLLADEYNRS